MRFGAELCISEIGVKEEAKLSLPGHQLSLQSGACRMFPHRRLWEAQVKITARPADNDDSGVNQGVVADV